MKILLSSGSTFKVTTAAMAMDFGKSIGLLNCNNLYTNKAVRSISLENLENTTIEINHLDANIYIYMLKLLSNVFVGNPPVDTNIFFGKLDMLFKETTTSIRLDLLKKDTITRNNLYKKRFKTMLLYEMGIERLKKDLGFPIISSEKQDITDIFLKIASYRPKYIISMGMKEYRSQFETFKVQSQKVSFLK